MRTSLPLIMFAVSELKEYLTECHKQAWKKHGNRRVSLHHYTQYERRELPPFTPTYIGEEV